MKFLKSLLEKIQSRKKSSGNPNFKSVAPPAYLEKSPEWHNHLPKIKPSQSISSETLDTYSADYNKNEKNELAHHVIRNASVTDILLNGDILMKNPELFSEKIDLEGNITNQKSSGRCWIFAATNCMRLVLMKKYNLKTFELSQNYLFFFDKFEKCNYFLETMVELALIEEPDSRLIDRLFSTPVNDGGQWDMLVNVVEKYGVVPQCAFPETYHSSNSSQVNWLVTKKLREYGITIRKALREEKKSVEQVRELKTEMLNNIYRILVTALGEPPKTFDWRFRNEDGKFHSLDHITPKNFYENHIKPGLGTGEDLGVGSYVSLVNDPRHPYYTRMTVKHLGNVYEGKKINYLNVPVEVLKEAAYNTIKDGKPVWFGCDVGKFYDRKHGVMDLNMYNYRAAFGVDVVNNMTKAERLMYNESLMTHAMVFTGVHVNDSTGSTERWRVENSWGVSAAGTGSSGFEIMNDDWFSEYTYQVVVEKKYLRKDLEPLLGVSNSQPIIELPLWDPMGSLA
ncbi:hypothetical protein HK099_002602 [Clydaea vesicula]|uniref:Cysteine proteinase 1, mitochondrial n=1 Tax=Clydaea vesicula TaxID=447962 RepID=A0AAD5U2Q3_9FUNG|nr:hypothetical protein HK099_002602 [Clydaea vesicula]KAJ3387549.1 hypothetical protein HDU92_001907 [Lobulomyces angularis]